MSNRYTILLILLAVLFAGCIDRSIDIYDPDYPTDGYEINPAWSQIDTNNLRPIALYNIPITFGKEEFKNLTARFSNASIIDTAIFNRELRNNRIALYFISDGVCTLTIDGLHPNNRHTIVSRILRVANPYRICGDSLFALGETGRYRLLPPPLSDSTNLDLVTGWQLDTGTVSTLAPCDTFMFSSIEPGKTLLQAFVTDTLYGHTLMVDSIGIYVPGSRPTLDSLTIITDTLFPGQQPRIQIFANDSDSTSLDAIISSQRKGVWNDTFNLSNPGMYSSILSGKSVVDTGTMIFTVTIIDPSGLASDCRTGYFTSIAHPPKVHFIPDTTEIALLVNIRQTLYVTETADTFVWTIDGEDTVTDVNQISGIFLTDAKKTANVSVYGIDRYGYRGPMASIRIVEETNVYDCALYGPGDSAYIDRACWTAKTWRRERVNEYGALFYWEITRVDDSTLLYRDTLTPQGDSSSTLCLNSLSIPGISLDSSDIKILVILKDTVEKSHVSPVRTQQCAIRPFRPVLHIVDVLPRTDTIAVNQEVFVRFEANDVNRNGTVDSIFWKSTERAAITALSPSVDSILMKWTQEGTASLCIWAKDNDGEISDTVRVPFVVIKNRPKVNNISISRPTVYALERCTLSVSVESGILRSQVEKTRWRFPGNGASVADTVVSGTSVTVSFAAPGRRAVSVVAIDAEGDTSLPYIDSLSIESGKPVVAGVSYDTTDGDCWVKDPIFFDISASDPNGSVTWYRIVLQKQGSADSLVTQSSSSRIPLLVPIGNEGVYTIIAYARDNDSLWSAGYQHPSLLTIRAGKPHLSVSVPAESWIHDTVIVRMSVFDTNGLVNTVICDWADGRVDTLTPVDPTQNVSDTLIHQYASHGIRTVRIAAVDDDGLSSVDTTVIIVKKGAPSVEALKDTFVWYDDNGYPGDTLDLNAAASDSNGTIVKYVWILKSPLDSSAKAPDTIITFTGNLKAGSANATFWGDHQPSYFKTDSTYEAAVYVIDDDGLLSKPDTFNFYIDAPRSPIATIEAKDGFNGNQSIFELTGGTSLNDSLIIKLQNIAPRDTNYLEIRISLVIDSLVIAPDSVIGCNDTLPLAADTMFAMIKSYETKLGQSKMVFSNSSWKVTYRPYSYEFIKYKQSGGSPWLYFRALIELRLRCGVVQKAVSPQSIKMSHTLTTFPE
jgi:hypothetical protein